MPDLVEISNLDFAYGPQSVLKGVDLRVGLSLGRSVRRLSLLRRIDVRRSELFPHVRIRQSRANLVVAGLLVAALSRGG